MLRSKQFQLGFCVEPIRNWSICTRNGSIYRKLNVHYAGNSPPSTWERRNFRVSFPDSLTVNLYLLRPLRMMRSGIVCMNFSKVFAKYEFTTSFHVRHTTTNESTFNKTESFSNLDLRRACTASCELLEITFTGLRLLVPTFPIRKSWTGFESTSSLSNIGRTVSASAWFVCLGLLQTNNDNRFCHLFVGKWIKFQRRRQRSGDGFSNCRHEFFHNNSNICT